MRVVHVSSHSGFEWGDAGIGAAAGIGIAMLAAGAGSPIAAGLARGRLDTV